MDKINILFIISTASVGGGEQHLIYLADRLNPDKYNLFFASPFEGKFAEEIRKRNLPILILNARTKFKFNAVNQIKKFIIANKIKIVHSHGARMGFYARIAAKWAGVPAIISTVHISVYKYPVAPWLKWIYLFLDNATLRLCDKIVCVSQGLAEELISKASLDPQKIVVICNGIDLDRFSYPTDTSHLIKELGLDSRRIIGVITRLAGHKGHRYLIEAVKGLSAYFPDIACLIVGEGPMRPSLERLARELGVSKYCLFLGTRRDIPAILSLLEVLVLPSFSEGLPLILLEAMAMRKAIVATRIEGVVELIQDGQNGLLVPPGNSSVLTLAIKRLLENRSEMDSYGAAGRTLVEKNYRVEQMIAKIEDLYDNCLQEKLK